MPYHTKFKCHRCGYCCTMQPRVTEADIIRIEKEGFSRDYFTEEGMDGTLRMKMTARGCVFLKKKGKNAGCEVYKHRPRICRIYPSYEKDTMECSEWFKRH